MFENKLIGMKKDEALSLVKTQNLFVRVASEDDRLFVGTVRFDRFNLFIKDGVVVDVVVG